MKNFVKGETVHVECDGQRVEGVVILASSNGKSLMLGFEAVIDGHVGMMPVSREDDGTYYTLMTGKEVKLK